MGDMIKVLFYIRKSKTNSDGLAPVYFKDDWSKNQQSGELVYKAVCNGVDGTVRITREEGKVAIQLDFTQKDKLTPNVELRINSFSKI